MLPEPTVSFTLPSLHEKTILTCRLYHPLSLSPSPRSPPWRRHAAVFAHPYAPLGGCYDDPVVVEVVSTMLRVGYLVGTFNFRGAGGSGGRTSWTARPERRDYMSVASFMVHYMHHLDPFERAGHAHAEIPILVLGGYSYGALVATQLPPIDQILEPFARPVMSSPATEIRLRAQHLAEHQNTILSSVRDAWSSSPRGKSPRTSLGMRVGGSETGEAGQDVRRSFSVEAEERIRKGIGEIMAKTKLKHKARDEKGDKKEQHGEHEQEQEHLEQVPDLIVPRVAYVLVSPLQGLVTHLATMSFVPSAASLFSMIPGRSHKETAAPEGSSADSTPDKAAETELAERKLTRNPTLAVFGDSDVFVSVQKLRAWAQRLQNAEGSRFHAVEVSSAGHFWVEDRVLYKLGDLVREFSLGLLKGDS